MLKLKFSGSWLAQHQGVPDLVSVVSARDPLCICSGMRDPEACPVSVCLGSLAPNSEGSNACMAPALFSEPSFQPTF